MEIAKATESNANAATTELIHRGWIENGSRTSPVNGGNNTQANVTSETSAGLNLCQLALMAPDWWRKNHAEADN